MPRRSFDKSSLNVRYGSIADTALVNRPSAFQPVTDVTALVEMVGLCQKTDIDRTYRDLDPSGIQVPSFR